VAAVAVQQASGAGLALAVRDGAPRHVARYLASLKPILSAGTDARGAWVRFLSDVARREDLVAAHAEAQQMALGQGQHLDEARRALASVQVPPGFEPMHMAVDRWLGALVDSCEVVFRSQAPLAADTLARARQGVHEAGVEADAFNRQRQTVVESLANRAAPAGARPRLIAQPRELRALGIGLVVALVMVGGSIYGMMRLTAVDPPPEAPASTRPIVGPIDRRIFPQPEVLTRLKTEIGARRVAFTEADIQLVAPDRAIVKGRIQGPASQIPVEAELQMSVTADNRPRIDSRRLSAVGVQIPTEALDALNKRVEEANKTLPDQIPAGFTLRRLFVENNAVVAELEGPAPPPAPAKPGP
jgi:hypothetical protein